MALIISKKVRSGSLVMRHGSKFVRCSSLKRVVGVYQEGFQQTLIVDADREETKRMIVAIPQGIVVFGPARACYKG